MDEIVTEEADFPPLVTPFRLREKDDAFASAIDAAQGSGDAHRGAGSLHFVGRFELIEFAITLEPEEPLRLARKIFYAGMNALADALALLAPPEKPISFRYPGSLYFDSALVGGGRLAWPEGCAEDVAPDWLVFGAMVRAGGVRDHGLIGIGPEFTTLDDEGFEAWNPPAFSASFARNFLVEVDSWGERGMRDIGPRYLARLEKAQGETRRGIDENGDLLVHEEGRAGARRADFVEGLRKADWLDPESREPRM
jgi:biotin-(acetyl-CoA carboxylase) ligase